MESKQICVKIDSASKIKRLRDVPETYEALKTAVEAQLRDSSSSQQPESSPKNYEIKYVDGQNDMINISDDDDLQAALDVAKKELQGNLKISVSFKEQALKKVFPLDKAEEEAKYVKDKKKEAKAAEKKERKEKETKTGEKREKKEKKKASKKLEGEGKKPRERANTVEQPQQVDYIPDETPSSDREEEEEEKVEKAKHCCSKNGLPPRGAIKKLIVGELEKHAPQIFAELVKCKELNNNSAQNSSPSEFNLRTHLNVACDGCGVHPIMGIRYKCSVCQSFDYCEICEDRLPHEHPFIKIVRPDNVPTSIITAVNEAEPNPECQMGLRGHHGGRRHHGHHHGHHQPEEGDQVHTDEGFHRGAHRGFRGGHCHRGGRGNTMWRNVVDTITRGIIGQCSEEQEALDENADGLNQWATAFGEKRSKWSEYRAMIINKPKEPVVAQIGQVIMVPIEFQNQTKWPWKRGCTLITSPKQDIALQGIVINKVYIDCDVKGMQTQKLDIPIKITDQFKAQLTDGSAGFEVRKIYLSFCGPKGNMFGQEIVIEVKVMLDSAKTVPQEEIFRIAIEMSESMNIASFEECVEALKKCNGDQSAAVQMFFQ